MHATCDPAHGLLETLHRHFGHQQFRPGQQQVVDTVLGGRDVLAVMPTGSGKSLGYQLPAVMLPGLTLVVSPLISLMKDQVDDLNRRGIRSGALHSMLSGAAKREVLAAARQERLRLLYVAPERFASDEFAELLAGLRISRFVIDEAHCVSEWGHDFRPDYRRLKEAAFGCRTPDAAHARPPIAAFTATATQEVRDDIVGLLGLASPEIIVAGFDRPNIHLRVERISDEDEKFELLPSLVAGRRALVYAATRKSTEAAAERLRDADIQASAYHAGLDDKERTRVQDAFASGALQIVCATNAFGMGIDRPDVDAVVHFAIPGSLEAYYQEIGRAGRDGREATATLLWDRDDIALREYLIDAPPRRSAHRRFEVDPEEVARRKAIEHARLQRMIAYADTSRCLRATILDYFGDRSAGGRCRSCGNCRPFALDVHELRLVRTILAAVAGGGERYGRRRIAGLLAGDTGDLPPSLVRLPQAGALRHEGAERIGDWIQAAIGAGLITVSQDQYRTLAVTNAGRDAMAGRGPMAIERPPRIPSAALRRHVRELRTPRRRRRWLEGEW
jgi:ATP-dependent DNA helicase RecQ